ncbi:hypothetical protein JCM16303_001360 [Sporobolomyces ruberrimus]
MSTRVESIELASLPTSPSPLPSESLPPSKAQSITSQLSQQPLNILENDTDTRLRSKSNGNEQSLPPVDRGFAAWSFVVAATTLETFIWGFGISFSVILVHLENHQPWSSASLASLSSIGTIQLGLMFFLTFGVNNAFRRYPDKAKPSLYIAGVVYSLSMLLSSFANKVWQLILTQGVLCGVSGAVLYGPCLLWTMSWFVEKRGLASGLIFSGTGLGGAAFPFVLGKLLDSYGFAWTCRIWAIICAVSFGLSTYFIRPRIPPPKFAKGQARPKWFIADLKTLNHPINWTISITTLIASLAYFPVSLYLPIYTQSLLNDTTSFTPNIVAAVFNLVAFLASMAIGWASDKSLGATATVVGVAGGAVALGAWSTADSLTKVFVFASVFGATTPISSYWGAATNEIGGADPYISGLLLCAWGMIRGLASILAPFLSAALYNPNQAHETSDEWGRFGFRNLIIFVGVLSLFSSLGGVVLGFLKMKSNIAKRRGLGPA